MTSSALPWVSGPAEILRHGLSLLEKDSDTNRRLAMIVIDNSVELAIKTYLGLPNRVTGLGISRKEFEETQESFPRLITLLERTSADKLSGINLGEIEWYHRLRNQLYHNGNGLTVERTKVEVYSQLARLLFKNLFGAEVVHAPKTQERLGTFLEEWIRLERAIADLSTPQSSKQSAGGERPTFRYPESLAELQAKGILTSAAVQEIKGLRDLRNRLVHGERRLEDVLAASDSKRVAEIAQELEAFASINESRELVGSSTAKVKRLQADYKSKTTDDSARTELDQRVSILLRSLETLPAPGQQAIADRMMRDAILFAEEDLQSLASSSARMGSAKAERAARVIHDLRWLRDRANEVRSTPAALGFDWSHFRWDRWAQHYVGAKNALNSLVAD